MRIMMLRYGPSNSGRLMARKIGARLIKLTGSRYVARRGDVVVNWGSGSDLPGNRFQLARIINQPASVRQTSNKLCAFVKMDGRVSTVPYTCRTAEAMEWLEAGATVVARTELSGHSGSGIVLCKPGDPLAAAPLYTKYMKKTHEFRVHVNSRGHTFVQQKRRRHGTPDEEVNWQIRNHDNGFIYASNDVEYPAGTCRQELSYLAYDAIHALDLHFGAVDVGYHKDTGPLVYEVNTAPGVCGATSVAEVGRLLLQEIFETDEVQV